MPNPASKINNLLSIAIREIGVKEQPANSNHVKYNNYTDNPWCMAFVQWCCSNAKISIPNTWSCTYFYTIIRDKTPGYDISQISALIPPEYLFYHQSDLKPGDIVLFNEKNTGLYEIDFSHVGIVIKNMGNGNYQTVEGNTASDDFGSQDNGGCVAKKNRTANPSISNFYIRAAVRLIDDKSGTPQIPQSTINAFVNEIKEQVTDNYKGAYFASQAGVNYQFGGAFNETTESIRRNTQTPIEYQTVQGIINVDKIIDTKVDPNKLRVKGTSLLTTPTYVESPFIILEVGDYTFGSYTAKNTQLNQKATKIVTYPNYMTSIDVVKVNGSVNQYTIEMVYQIEAGNDPNLIDKIFSKVGYGGLVYISYGDWNMPSFRYKREEAIITNLTSRIDFANSRINYTLKCTSNAIKLLGDYHSFSAGQIKPSTEIYDYLYKEQNKLYKLTEMFPGMKNETLVRQRGLIPTDDIIVKTEAKVSMDILSYINYLVSCMTDSQTESGLRKSNYYLTICDDITGEFGGTYFKISKLTADSNSVAIDSSNIYEVDVGYPGDTLVTGFNIVTDNSWSLLYNYSNDLSQEQYTYDIDSNGNIIQTSSPNILRSATYGRVTEEQRNWWTQMTQFPITATLEIKGLLRPAMLMTYVRINALFYGQRHVSSGIYAITRQQDRIDARGYRTTLSLVRIAGDNDTIQNTDQIITYSIPKATATTNESIVDNSTRVSEYTGSGRTFSVNSDNNHNFSGNGGNF